LTRVSADICIQSILNTDGPAQLKREISAGEAPLILHVRLSAALPVTVDLFFQ
jgi:hypothetical protein